MLEKEIYPKICKQLVDDIVKTELCTHCGTCVGVCPTNVYYFENNTIKSRDAQCINCMNCIKCCPGKSFSYPTYNKSIFNAEMNDIDPSLGYYRNIYTAQSLNGDVLLKSSSGGFVTELLCYLLAQGIVDGAVIVDPDSKFPNYRRKITENIDEIKRCSQSVYCIFPSNEIIQEMANYRGTLAFVGLPCQIQGIRKILFEKLKIFRNDIVLIGLFCGFNMFDEGTNAILKKYKVKKEDIFSLRYRQKKDAETGLEIKLISGSAIYINKHHYNFLNAIYSPQRCLKCYDYSSEFADISVGDAWEINGGGSRVIIRNPKMEQIFLRMIEMNIIKSKNSGKADILACQNQVIVYKKKWIFQRKKRAKYFPDYDIECSNISMKNRLKGLIFNMILSIGHSNFGKNVISLIPTRLIFSMSSLVRNQLNEKQ